VTVASVGVTHPRGNLLQLAARFAEPLPPSASYGLTYSLANNGTTLAVLTSQQGSDDPAIRNGKGHGGADVRMAKTTYAARTAADTIEISLDVTKFGITQALVSPGLSVWSQLNSPPVVYAAQICHGQRNTFCRTRFQQYGYSMCHRPFT
jgi:hypothetical protein